MSVINTMLKDLEKRGGKHDRSKEDILQGLSASTAGMMRERGFNPYMVSLFSVLGVCDTAARLSVFALSAGDRRSGRAAAACCRNSKRSQSGER